MNGEVRNLVLDGCLTLRCCPSFKQTGKVDFVASQSDPKTWKCIRGPKGGEPEVTQGPWAEVREQVGAFFIVDAEDMDEALAVAMKHPGPHVIRFCGGGLEIRACDFYEEPTKDGAPVKKA